MNWIDMLTDGYRIIPTRRDKTPRDVGWAHKEYTEKELSKHMYDSGGNVAWALGVDDLIMDIDPRNGGMESYNQLLKDLDLVGKLTVTVKTPSGGYHIYFKHNLKGIHKRLRDYPGIDFIHGLSNMFALVPPSMINGVPYVWLGDWKERQELPQGVIDLINRDNKSHRLSSGGKDEMWFSRQKVVAMLAAIDVIVDGGEYDNWLKTGMALYNWDDELGLELWEEWSKGDPNKYEPGLCAKKWETFSPDGLVTMGTLVHFHNVAMETKKRIAFDKLLGEIRVASYLGLRTRIIPAIKQVDYDKIELEQLVNAIRERYKHPTVANTLIPKNELRKQLAYEPVDEETEELIKPDWCKNFIYSNARKTYIDLDTMVDYRTESFNIKFGDKVPIGSKGGGKMLATKYIADNGFLEVVDSEVYAPQETARIIREENLTYLNLFDHTSLPGVTDKYLDGDDEYIQTILDHITLICGEYSEHIVFWLAHNVQYMGEKIRWVPLIQGGQGIGKGMMGNIFKAVLGQTNIVLASSDQVKDKWNSWAVGYLICILDELQSFGGSVKEINNRLKIPISDSMITIEKKHCNPITMPNRTNYFALTNYKDFLSLDKDDRRWFIVFSTVQNKKHLEELTSMKYYDYFNKLEEAIRIGGRAFRKYLLELDIPMWFKNLKEAPMTSFKESLIRDNSSVSEPTSGVNELIEQGGFGYNTKVIVGRYLWEAYQSKFMGSYSRGLYPHEKSKMMRELGYHSLAKRYISVGGKAAAERHTLYVKYTMSEADLEKELAVILDPKLLQSDNAV